MHPYIVSDLVNERVLRRKGRPVSLEVINAERVALVVVDMQNHFVAEGFPAEVPMAREIVDNINRMAEAMRTAGGKVIWVQTTATGALERWGNHHSHGLSAEMMKIRLASLAENADGFKLYPALKPAPGDLRAKKIMFSALIQGSSNLQELLNGIDILLIAGTTTNVCCESTARDAMMLDYRVAMLADGCAAKTDDEHEAALNNFQLFFGDVMTTAEAISRL